jgi:hypothetical protein
MKKLVACALLGFGLTQVLVGCGDDDDVVNPGTSGSGTAGSNAGSTSGGTSSAGSSSGGKAGSANGGTAGKGSGGNATSGSGGKAGSSAGGTTADAGAGGDINAAGNGGAAGETGVGGGGGAGGEAPVEPQVASEHWLSEFCDAKSAEVLMCDTSPEWALCYSTYRPFLSTVAEGVCDGDDDPFPKTVALIEALDNLAAACPKPDVDQWRCTFDGAPQALDQACRDADDARRVAAMNCGL